MEQPAIRLCEGILESLPNAVPREGLVISRISISLKTSDKDSTFSSVEELKGRAKW